MISAIKDRTVYYKYFEKQLSENGIIIKDEIENVGVCVIIGIILLLLSMIVPLITVHGKQPRDVLKTEFRT